jgi:hypothetical protein
LSLIHLNHASESAAGRAAVCCSESERRQQGHGDTPTNAQHTRSLGFDARIAAASRHQSTTVQQTMRQTAKRTRAVCGGRGPGPLILCFALPTSARQHAARTHFEGQQQQILLKPRVAHDAGCHDSLPLTSVGGHQQLKTTAPHPNQKAEDRSQAGAG